MRLFQVCHGELNHLLRHHCSDLDSIVGSYSGFLNYTLRIPFGLLDGVLVEPGTVANGKACGCVCPGCHMPLIAYNQGRIRATHYFGHRPDEQCTTGLETALHLAAKEALKREQRMALPSTNGSQSEAHIASYVQVDLEPDYLFAEEPSPETPPPAPEQLDFFPPVEPAPVATGLRLAFVGMPHYRADARGVHRDGTVDWIEVRVTNEVSFEKERWLQKHRARVVEVDLRRFLRAEVSLAEVQQAVVDATRDKRWINHPGIAEEAQPVRLDRLPPAVPPAPRIIDPKSARIDDLSRRQSRKWLSDGSETQDPQISREPRILTAAEWQAELRTRLRLRPSAPWPRYLDLEINADVGCEFPARIWLSLMYLDWIVGQTQLKKVLVPDLERSIYDRFGAGSAAQKERLRKVLHARVLRYWDHCQIIRYVDGTVLLKDLPKLP